MTISFFHWLQLLTLSSLALHVTEIHNRSNQKLRWGIMMSMTTFKNTGNPLGKSQNLKNSQNGAEFILFPKETLSLCTALTWGWAESQDYAAGTHSNNSERKPLFSSWSKRGIFEWGSVCVGGDHGSLSVFFSLADPALKQVWITKLYYWGRILKSLRENLSLCPKEPG